MDDQHGIGTCAEAETSVSVGQDREHAERVATRNAGQARNVRRDYYYSQRRVRRLGPALGCEAATQNY